MPGFQFSKRLGSGSTIPNMVEALIGKSTQIHAGDVLIKTNASAYNNVGPSGPAVIRPLLSGDTVTTSNGIFGVAMYDIQTDSNGRITTLSQPVTVDTRGKLDTYNMELNIFPLDPASGYSLIDIIAFDEQNCFLALSKSQEIVNYYDQGRAIGIFCSAASAPSNYQVTNTNAAANAPLICQGVNVDDPLFNSSASGTGAGMYVVCARTFDQGNNQNIWTT